LELLWLPNPTQQQKAATPGGMIYDHISLKLQRTELASEREAILKNQIQDAVTWTSKIPLGTSFAIWLQQLLRYVFSFSF
jgi:hypothetical protein